MINFKDKLKERFKNKDVVNSSQKKKLSKNQIISIVITSLLGLTHVVILLAIFLSFRYYSIYPSLFGSVVAIVICLLIIVDIVFFVGFNHKDVVLKTVSSCRIVILKNLLKWKM